jgi:transcriptional regulator with XRE-family HTH domain
MGTADRIFELVDQRFKEQKDFAAALGINPKTVSSWKRGVKSYQKYLPQIASLLGTSTEYLLNGSRDFDPANLSSEDEEILRQIHDRPGLRILFSRTSKATDKDLDTAVKVIEAVLGKAENQP